MWLINNIKNRAKVSVRKWYHTEFFVWSRLHGCKNMLPSRTSLRMWSLTQAKLLSHRVTFYNLILWETEHVFRCLYSGSPGCLKRNRSVHTIMQAIFLWLQGVTLICSSWNLTRKCQQSSAFRGRKSVSEKYGTGGASGRQWVGWSESSHR